MIELLRRKRWRKSERERQSFDGLEYCIERERCDVGEAKFDVISICEKATSELRGAR